MYFGKPVSTTTHSIPTYGTQSILIYGSSKNPSINYELNTPSLSQPNYGTTLIPINYVHIPAAIPLNQNGAMHSVIQPQMSNASLIQNSQLSVPCVPSSIVIPTNDNPHLVRNYPIDETDLRRLPRYSTFIPMMNDGSDYGDLKARTILPFTLVYPLLNQNTPIQGFNGVVPRMNNSLPTINTGLKPGLNNTGNYLNNQIGNAGIGLNNINPTVNNINNTTNNLTSGMNNIGSGINNITTTAHNLNLGVNSIGKGINNLAYTTAGISNTGINNITSTTNNLTRGVNNIGSGIGGLANTVNNLSGGVEPINNIESGVNAANEVGKTINNTANSIAATKRGINTIKNLF